MCWLAETISLNVSATFPASPTQVPGSRTVKSPSRMLCKLVRMTVRSKDPSASFCFPSLDFPPLFFAMVGGRFPVLLGAVSLSEDLFIVSPEKRSTSNQGFPGNRFRPNPIYSWTWTSSTTGPINFGGVRLLSTGAFGARPRTPLRHLFLLPYWYHEIWRTFPKV